MKPLRDKIRNEKCKLCDLYKQAQSPCLIGDGEYPTDIAIIGESPSFQGDNLNRPFAGKAGKKILIPLLEKLGLAQHFPVEKEIGTRPLDFRNA